MKIVLKLLALTLLVLISTSLVASNTTSATGTGIRLHEIAKPPMIILDSTFNPATVFNPAVPTGGAPFCFSGSLGTILCYPPNFLRKAYDFPSTLTGMGSTIVIVDAFGSPTIAADLKDFDGNFSIAAPPSFTILCGPTWTGAATDHCPVLHVTDPNIADELGWAEEITLDVTQAHALAPGAKIILVVSNSDYDSDLNAAEMAVVSQPGLAGSIMTQSFGEADDLVGCIWFPCNSTSPTPYFDPTIRSTYNSIMGIAQSNGWTVMASSGDDGANEAFSEVGTGELTPSYPATNPNVLAVGGTGGNPYGGQYGTSNPSVLKFPPGPGGTFTCAAGATCNTGLVVINGGATGCTTTATRTSGVPTSCFPTGYGGEGAWQEVPAIGSTRASTGGGISNDYYAGYPGYGYPAIGSYTRPSYQSTLPASFRLANGTSVESGSGQTVYSGGRATPDVAFNAASEGGVLAYMGPGSLLGQYVPYPNGRWVVFGGTSASSPAWAAIIALVQQVHGGPVGFINPAIYELAQSNLYSNAFHDIKVGNNTDVPFAPYCLEFCGPGSVSQTGYAAGTGYDLTTGWGSPDVAHFVADIQPFLAPANAYPGYSISLVPGWNLISLPLIPANTAINTVFGGLALAGESSIIWSYQGGKWLAAVLSGTKLTGTLKTAQDGFGYWVYMTTADTLWANGYIFLPPPATPPSYPLGVGWNLVGFKPEPTIGPEATLSYLSGLGTNYDSGHVYLYVNSSGAWTENPTNLSPGQAIWVYVTAASTLTP
jgi:subtilase family serine protease